MTANRCLHSHWTRTIHMSTNHYEYLNTIFFYNYTHLTLYFLSYCCKTWLSVRLHVTLIFSFAGVWNVPHIVLSFPHTVHRQTQHTHAKWLHSPGGQHGWSDVWQQYRWGMTSIIAPFMEQLSSYIHHRGVVLGVGGWCGAGMKGN